ncbi:MAG: Hsp20/alpha crystallin family protein [Chitinophagaceae bacterium]|jgi:HSP20 family protein|nr:Hsp20/alpha crystallin family protein [Chitinophagaceae bacterium]
MTHVKFLNRPVDHSLNNLMNDFFKHNADANFKNNVPVNISESNDAYRIDVISPGFDKNDFKISIDKNLLTLSLEKEENEKKEENVKQLRSEYSIRPFKRSFTLDEKIDAEQIKAAYVNGILTINLPFKIEVKAPVKQISIQ